MKKSIVFFVATLLVLGGCKKNASDTTNAAGIETATEAIAVNPFITHMYTADPSAHVWDDGRLYVYASHDIDPPRGCDLMDRYHVFSTDDMVNWVDHGEILNSDQVPWVQRKMENTTCPIQIIIRKVVTG